MSKSVIALIYQRRGERRPLLKLSGIAFIFAAVGLSSAAAIVAIIPWVDRNSWAYAILGATLIMTALLSSCIAIILGTLSMILYGWRAIAGFFALLIGGIILTPGIVMLPLAARF